MNNSHPNYLFWIFSHRYLLSTEILSFIRNFWIISKQWILKLHNFWITEFCQIIFIVYITWLESRSNCFQGWNAKLSNHNVKTWIMLLHRFTGMTHSFVSMYVHFTVRSHFDHTHYTYNGFDICSNFIFLYFFTIPSKLWDLSGCLTTQIKAKNDAHLFTSVTFHCNYLTMQLLQLQ